MGATAKWHWSHLERICILTCKKVNNDHSFFDAVTQILNKIDKLRRQPIDGQKERKLSEIKMAGKEWEC